MTAPEAGPLNAPPEDPPWLSPRFRGMPGTELIGPDEWLMISDRYAAQMALKDHLVATRPGEVLAATPEAGPSIAEMVETLCATLGGCPGYTLSEKEIHRPDGGVVPRDAPPLEVLARAVQEDICLLAPDGPEYRLIAASLCFPAHWRLDQKIGRPMTRIHRPVTEYHDKAASRVARLFQHLRPGLPICRHNGNFNASPTLFAPESEAEHHRPKPPDDAPLPYYRSERQCLLRLPHTGAIAFSIHTRVWRVADLPVPPPGP